MRDRFWDLWNIEDLVDDMPGVDPVDAYEESIEESSM